MKLVVAVLIIRKLMRQKQWGGKKGYLKSTDLPEGGIPPILKGLVLSVANDLRLHGALVHKIGDGRPKYGLNNANIEAIHTAANGDFRYFPALKELLGRDKEIVTVAYLKEDLHVQKFAITLPTGQLQQFPNVDDAIASLDAGPDGEYKICVHFNTHRQLWNKFASKSDLATFLSGFVK